MASLKVEVIERNSRWVVRLEEGGEAVEREFQMVTTRARGRRDKPHEWEAQSLTALQSAIPSKQKTAHTIGNR
ncbi:hypothetical protein [Rhizobium wenxiniae]|uniref:hypothetical protein n=1 Tax=Rhizobium wenxiniae TaxID=1737357 RepID=UPI003C1B928C